jgi:spore coat protein JB
MNKEKLMREIQEVGFALVDLNLFLDSHPDNKLALDFFEDMQIKYAQLQADYEMEFGPLTAFDTNTEQGWTWVQSPWPWELEA